MPYTLVGETFATKEEIKARCRLIRNRTSDGQSVDESSAEFLFELFQHHDEWPKKSAGGVCSISTQTSLQGTRCFVLVNKSGEKIDISFDHAVKLIPSRRTVALLPQPLLDFRHAARTAVQMQIFTFRDAQLVGTKVCPCTGEILTRNNCAVDHIPPKTFDRLLFEFCRLNSINPLKVAIDSLNGTVAVFQHPDMVGIWQNYHLEHAKLRLLSKTGNLQLPKTQVPWSELFT